MAKHFLMGDFFHTYRKCHTLQEILCSKYIFKSCFDSSSSKSLSSFPIVSLLHKGNLKMSVLKCSSVAVWVGELNTSRIFSSSSKEEWVVKFPFHITDSEGWTRNILILCNLCVFSNDYMFVDKQNHPPEKRLSLHYNPEPPNEDSGRKKYSDNTWFCCSIKMESFGKCCDLIWKLIIDKLSVLHDLNNFQLGAKGLSTITF